MRTIKITLDREAIVVIRVVRNIVTGLGIGAFVSVGLTMNRGDWRAKPAYASSPAQRVERVVLGAPGRVEGRSETVRVGAGISGILGSVLVREGDRVLAGDLLATLDARELLADAVAARHAVAVATESRNVLLHGSRTEARLSVRQQRIAAEADAEEARSRFARVDRLFKENVATSAELDQSRRDLDVAEAAAVRAAHDEALVDAPALAEEVRRANAAIAQAKALAEAAELRAQKLQVRAPVDGTILQILMRPGEAVSAVVPQPILAMADLTRLMVRAEIDEEDIGHVCPGQRVGISAIGIVSPEFTGRVERIAPSMGRVHVRTGDPAEKSDRDIREVVVALDEGPAQLPIGLRVTARFHECEPRHPAVPLAGDGGR